jgi:conjugative transfer pilus assembly protein TraH
LQWLLEAAPAYGFDIALITMCKECNEIVTKLEAVTDFLNSTQMNDICSGETNIFGEVWPAMSDEASVNNSTHKNWKEAQDKMHDCAIQVANLNKLTDGCPADFIETFKHGSLIADAVQISDLKNITPLVDLLRGYVEDIFITAGKEDRIPLPQQIIPCLYNRKNKWRICCMDVL